MALTLREEHCMQMVTVTSFYNYYSFIIFFIHRYNNRLLHHHHHHHHHQQQQQQQHFSKQQTYFQFNLISFLVLNLPTSGFHAAHIIVSSSKRSEINYT
jgi:UDP-N-acetylmuramyl pentapeptide phosphotransferase/UDP-N-acetylglucosamine-1-phosphate transferase